VTIKSRLRRLSRELQPRVCPECRDRKGRLARVVASRSLDGAMVPQNDAPSPCSRCGEVPEQVVQVVEEVVEVRLGAVE
jgi:hypothetical protein